MANLIQPNPIKGKTIASYWCLRVLMLRHFLFLSIRTSCICLRQVLARSSVCEEPLRFSSRRDIYNLMAPKPLIPDLCRSAGVEFECLKKEAVV